MKAVILAAGRPGRDFPPGCKQKCLFHYQGCVLLDIATDALLEAGVTDIRMVLGYGAKSVEDHVRDRKLDVELVYNEAYADDAVRSLEVGLAGVDTDVLVMASDLIGINATIIRGFQGTDPHRPAWVRSVIPWDHDRGLIKYDEMYRPDTDIDVVKIPRRLLGVWGGARERAARFIARYHWTTPTGPGTGVHYGAAVYATFWEHRPVDEVVIAEPMGDVDDYPQTDEARLAR